MKKKIIIVGSILLVILVIVISVLVMNSNKYKDISIILYEEDTTNIIQEVKIEDNKEIKKLNNYLKDLEDKSKNTMINLELIQQIELKYDDNVYIQFQLGQKEYCYLVDNDKNIKNLISIPDGLYDFVMNKLGK